MIYPPRAINSRSRGKPAFFSRLIEGWKLRWTMAGAIAGRDDDDLARSLRLIEQINDKLRRKAKAAPPLQGIGKPSLREISRFVDVKGLLARRDAFSWEKIFALRCPQCRTVFAFAAPLNEGLALIRTIDSTRANGQDSWIGLARKKIGAAITAALRRALAASSGPLAGIMDDGNVDAPSRVCPRCEKTAAVTPQNAAYFP
ncbi:MAG: hypothetical protein ACYCPQ_03090 [Elusimicrobiota bacterium]